MKKLLAAIAIGLIAYSTSALADSTIDNLGAGAAVQGTDIFPAYQGANPATGVTAAQIKTFTGGGPGGSSGQLQYNNSSAFGAVSGSSVDSNGSLTLGGATVTTSDPVINITQTWNAGAVTFTGQKFTLTNTASANGSIFADYSVGSKYARIVVTNGNNNPSYRLSDGSNVAELGIDNNGGTVIGNVSNNFVGLLPSDGTAGNVSTWKSLSNGAFGWVSSGSPTNFGDTFMFRGAAGVVTFSATTASAHDGWINYAGQTRVASDVSFTSNTTLGTVTGLSVNVAAGRTYHFDAHLSFTDAAAGGIKAAIAGTATATNIVYDGWIVDSGSNGIKGNTQATALATTVASSTTTGTAGFVKISGTITVNAAGTLLVQAAQNTSSGTATTIKQGSTFIVQDMP